MDELFKDFHPSSAADWKARLEKDLKGITFEQLSTIDRNGITIRPFYHSEDIAAPEKPLRTEPGWSICSQILVTDTAAANRQALQELNNGASGLCFLITDDADPAVLLQEIELPYIHTCFQLSKHIPAFTERLKAYAAEQGWSLKDADSFISFDYIGDFISRGQWPGSREQEEQNFVAFLNASDGIASLSVEAGRFHNAGATSTYELACLLAQLNEYFTLLEANQQLAAIKRIRIAVATDTSFFEQIAKLRALREVLPLLFEAYNVTPGVHIHVETGNTYRAPFDSYSNLLRDTVAAMAGVIGGANSLYIHPFDETKDTLNDFSRRMSRNQQLIFKEESYLDKVADAAAGSYYLEQLTEQIAEKAWEQFKEIENNGGLIASFEGGALKETIEQQAAQLVQDYKDGKRVLIGVNKFPNPKDEPKALPAEASTGKGIQALNLTRQLL